MIANVFCEMDCIVTPPGAVTHVVRLWTAGLTGRVVNNLSNDHGERRLSS